MNISSFILKTAASISVSLVIFILAGCESPASQRPISQDPIAEVDAYIQEKIESGEIDRDNPDWKTKLPKFKPMGFSPDQSIFWDLKTNKGDMRIQLFSTGVPDHVSSTIYLSRLGFYNGLTFHRVIPDFMAQGGCPDGSGMKGPGYEYGGEFAYSHIKRGQLSMANSGPDTDGSQFFITFGAQPMLNKKHTVFGELVEGKDTLKALEFCGSPSGKPKEPLIIESSDIVVEQP